MINGRDLIAYGLYGAALFFLALEQALSARMMRTMREKYPLPAGVSRWKTWNHPAHKEIKRDPAWRAGMWRQLLLGGLAALCLAGGSVLLESKLEWLGWLPL